MDGLPLIASGLDIEQQIGPFFLEMRKEEHPAHYLGVFGMRFRPCIPFIDDALLCRAVFVRHGGLLLHLQRRCAFTSVLMSSRSGRARAEVADRDNADFLTPKGF